MLPSPTAPPRRLTASWRLLPVVLLFLGLAGCGPRIHLGADEAVDKYAPLADDVAAAISGSGVKLTGDDRDPWFEGTSEECSVGATIYTSQDLIIEAGTSPPDAEPLVAAAEDVLTEHGFAEFELNDEYAMPMEIYRAADDEGGWMSITVESRPGRDTVDLMWRAQLETQGEACDEGLLG